MYVRGYGVNSGLWSRHKYATAPAPAPELSSITKKLRLQLRSSLLLESSSGSELRLKLRSPRSYDAYNTDQRWAALGKRALMSGTRANPWKYDPSAFQMRKIHKLQATVLFDEAWCSHRHFRFFDNSLFILNLFGAKYANQDTLPSSNVWKSETEYLHYCQIHYRLACYVTEWTPLALDWVVISQVFFSRMMVI